MLSIFRKEREALLDCSRGNERIESSQAVRFRVALEQLVRQARNLRAEIRTYIG